MERAHRAAAEMTYLVECFWPGVSQEQLVLAGAQARQAALQLSADGAAVRYLGAILVPADEVVFYLFESASAEFVRAANERAAIPFERIVESVQLPAAGEAAALAGLPMERVLETRFIASDDGIGLSPNAASKEER
jgi:hypothetical protein